MRVQGQHGLCHKTLQNTEGGGKGGRKTGREGRMNRSSPSWDVKVNYLFSASCAVVHVQHGPG